MGNEPSPDRELVVLKLALRIGNEQIALEVPVPRGQASMSDLLPFMRAVSKLSADIAEEQAAAEGKSISCRSGCAMCCRQVVALPHFEARRLAALVDGLPEPRQTEVRARFEAARRRLEEHDLIDALDSGNEAAEQRGLAELAAAYFRLQIECPFLEDEACTIYDERPLTCREYLVTSPPELCDDPVNNDPEGLPLSLKPSTASMMVGFEQSGSGPTTRWIGLPLLLEWAKANPDDDPAATGPELFEQLMTALTGGPPRSAPGM